MWVSDKAYVQIRMVQYETKTRRRRLRWRRHRLLRESLFLLVLSLVNKIAFL